MLFEAILCLCLIFGTSSGLSAQEKQDSVLTLSQDDAVALAFKQNPQLESARLEVERRKSLHQSKQSKLLPQVNIKANYNYTLKKQRMYLGGGDDESSKMMSRYFPEEGIEVGMTHNIQAGIQAGMPLIVPQLWTSLKLSRKEIEEAQERARSSKLKLQMEVRKSYLGILLAEELYQTLKQSIDNIKESYKNAQEKHQRGLIAEYDLLRLETQAQNLQPQLIQAEQQRRLAELKLKLLLHLNTKQSIQLSQSLGDYKEHIYKDGLSKQTSSLEQNSQIRLLSLQREKLKTGILTQKMSFLPSLNMHILYNYNYANNQFELDKKKRWSPYSMIGLTLNIPLFNGGERFSKLKALNIQLQQIGLQQQQMKQELQLVQEQIRSEQKSALEQFVASEQAVKMAERGLKIAQARYKNGLSSILELNDAELSQRQAELNLHKAIYQYMLTQYQQEELEGKE